MTSPERPWWQRWWVLLGAGLLLLLLFGALSGGPTTPPPRVRTRPRRRRRRSSPTRRRPPAPGAPPSRGVASTSPRFAAYERAGLDEDADRVRRRGARALYRAARRALRQQRYMSARRLATRSRQLRKTGAARAVLVSANAGIAKANAAAAERRRLAEIARDARTCTSGEKATVRNDGGTPAGCASYAADLAGRRAEREANKAPATPDCDPNYTGACLKPDSPDYDCAGGSGNGPDYTGPVQSIGSDPYDLDRDGDGSACEG